MKKLLLAASAALLWAISVGKVAGEDWADYSVFQWQETRSRLGIGPDYFNVGSQQDASAAVSLRYRISPEAWPQSEDQPWHLGPVPLNIYLEAGSILPHTGSSLGLVSKTVNASTDNAQVKLNWQGHFVLGSEIPLGQERWLVPDIALGLAAASLKNKFDSRTVDSGDDLYGEDNHTALSPYFRFGLSLFPDHVVSFRISAAHVSYSNNFSHDFNYPSAPQDSHPQTFDLSLSGWQILPMIEIKLLWPSAVHVPLVPQALPPWLLPSYTTEAVSPWVASPEVAKDPRYNRPGQASVGNVMFQYKNRWVEKVELIGDFNDWTPERMLKDRSGIWVLVKDLPPGKFRYNYLIDGKKEIMDPWNKDRDADSRSLGSSVVTVKDQ